MVPVRSYTRADLEPLSFDDLPLGGEWTTRRRTISDSEIALFVGVSGDFSPLSIEGGHTQPRVAPPTLVVAVAVGLGTIDMPVPAVEEWEWLNWKFPRPIHAGDTIYARWTLTQKRPPIGSAPTSIVVWRVDVHTADGALCAEGEVGAKVRRQLASRDRSRERSSEAAAATAAPAGTAAPRRSRRRRRPAGANGPLPETPAVAAMPASPVSKPERAGGAPRRRRRRRPATGSSGRDGEPASTPAATPEPAQAPPPPPAAKPAATRGQGGLGGVIRRLRPRSRQKA